MKYTKHAFKNFQKLLIHYNNQSITFFCQRLMTDTIITNYRKQKYISSILTLYFLWRKLVIITLKFGADI